MALGVALLPALPSCLSSGAARTAHDALDAAGAGCAVLVDRRDVDERIVAVCEAERAAHPAIDVAIDLMRRSAAAAPGASASGSAAAPAASDAALEGR